MQGTSFAQLSNLLVYGTITALVLAFFAFAGDLAFGSGKLRASRAVGSRQLAFGQGITSERSSVRVLDEAPPESGNDPRWARVGVSLAAVGFIMLATAVLFRGVAAGRPPWGNMYEFSLAGALSALGVWLFLVHRRVEVRDVGIVVVGFVLLTLGVAVVVLYTEAAQLVPALQSYWMWIHVTAAITSSGIFVVGSSASALYLVAARYESRVAAGPAGGRLAWLDSLGRRLPAADGLDQIAYRAIAFAFPLWFFAVVAGAIWAEGAWGRYWGWDPKETWAFITLVIYAAYLHARSTAGWKGRPAAVIALLGFGAFLFSYIGVNIFLFGLHSYGGM